MSEEKENPPSQNSGERNQTDTVTTNSGVNQAGPRSIHPIEEGPYLWISKDVLRRLSRCDLEKHGSSLKNCQLVYLALAWESSDRENPVFDCSKGPIKTKSGLEKSTVKHALRALEKEGFISVDRQRKPGSVEFETNIYTLLTFKPKVGQALTDVGRNITKVGQKNTRHFQPVRKNSPKGRENHKEEALPSLLRSPDGARTGAAQDWVGAKRKSF